MNEQVPKDLLPLIVKYVQIYSCVTDLELDLHMVPKPKFMPLNSYEAKREAAHYFLLAAALSDYKLMGNPRNIRLLLNHLSKSLESNLYFFKNSSDFTFELAKFESEIKNFDRLGDDKKEIPDVLASVNRYVEQRAGGDLIDHAVKLSLKGRKPNDFAEELSYAVKRLNKQHKAKSWLYLRWMVRPSPDLGLFNFKPKDLMIPLTTPKLRVFAALGLSSNENLPFVLNNKNRPDSYWENTAQFDADAEKLTIFARKLFPDDPAKVDFPFFILGSWLEYSDLTLISLERSLRFFIQKYQELLQPLLRYLTIVYHYNRAGEAIQPGAFSGLERDVYEFLCKKQVLFNYEFMEFRLSTGNSRRSLTYKPDFLLSQITNKGRKVLLEPHGVKNNLREFLYKLQLFRRHYKEYFALILLVPDDFVPLIEKIDPKHNAFDLIWKQSNYKIEYEKLQST
jgi:hypothetical protein